VYHYVVILKKVPRLKGLTQHKQSVLPVWAVLADLLVSEGAAKHSCQYRSIAKSFQSLVQTVDQTVEKLQGIVLFAQVHWLSLKSTDVQAPNACGQTMPTFITFIGNN